MSSCAGCRLPQKGQLCSRVPLGFLRGTREFTTSIRQAQQVKQACGAARCGTGAREPPHFRLGEEKGKPAEQPRGCTHRHGIFIGPPFRGESKATSEGEARVSLSQGDVPSFMDGGAGLCARPSLHMSRGGGLPYVFRVYCCAVVGGGAAAEVSSLPNGMTVRRVGEDVDRLYSEGR